MIASQRRAPDGSDTETRRHLIEATQRLLSTSSSTPVTSRAIADAAAANLGAITYYFGSKDDLVAESMLQLAHSLLEPVIEVLAAAGDPVAKMMEAVTMLNATIAEHRAEASAYVQVLAAGTSGAPIAGELRALLRAVEDLLADQIEIQQHAGALPAWIAAVPMAQMIVALAHGTLVLDALEPERVDHIAVSAQFVQLLLAARSPAPGRS